MSEGRSINFRAEMIMGTFIRFEGLEMELYQRLLD